MTRAPLTAAVLLASASCRAQRYEDIGEACLGEPEPWDSGATLVIAPGGSTPVTVVLDRSASSDPEWLEQTCVTTVERDRIGVATGGETRTRRSAASDAAWVSQDCGTVELTEGSWTLAYADGEVDFSVPYEGPLICVPAGG